MADEQKVFIPPKRVNTDYPVIDTDPYVLIHVAFPLSKAAS